MPDSVRAPAGNADPVRGVAVITDSTATLDADRARELGITIVPITVVIDDESFDETDDPQGGRVTEALRAHRRVTTSRPSPERFLEAYRTAADRGARAVVCATLSRRLSATGESAELAARASAIPVTVVDSRTVAMGMGYAVIRGAELAGQGADAQSVADTVGQVAARTSLTFCVDSLEHLRRGGRIGGAAALLGQALQVRPLLQIAEGEVAIVDRVRTTARALDRLCALAVERAGGGPAEIAVQHLGALTVAEEVAGRLRGMVPAARVQVRPIGASLGAHVGPGLVAVAVSPG